MMTFQRGLFPCIFFVFVFWINPGFAQESADNGPSQDSLEHNDCRRVIVTPGIGAGFTVAAMRFVNEKAVYHNQQFKSTVGVYASVSLYMAYRDRWLSKLELSYSAKRGTFHRSNEDLSIFFGLGQLSASQYYHFKSRGRARPFVSAGVLGGYCVARNVTLHSPYSSTDLDLLSDKWVSGGRFSTGIAFPHNVKIEYVFEFLTVDPRSSLNRMWVTSHTFLISL